MGADSVAVGVREEHPVPSLRSPTRGLVGLHRRRATGGCDPRGLGRPARTSSPSLDRTSEPQQRLARDCHGLVGVDDDLRVRAVDLVTRIADHHAFNRRVHCAVPRISEPDAIERVVTSDASDCILQKASRVTKTSAAEDVEIVHGGPAKRRKLGHGQTGIGASEPVEDALGSIVFDLPRGERGRGESFDVGLQFRSSGVEEATTVARSPKPGCEAPERRKKELAR